MKIIYNIERFKIRVGLFKHKYIFRVYKNTTGQHSIGCRKLFEGSYNECLQFVKDNNIKLKEVFEI